LIRGDILTESDFIGIALKLEKHAKDLYHQIVEHIGEDKLGRDVELLAEMKGKNIRSLESIRSASTSWDGAKVDAIRRQCLDYINLGMDEVVSLRALEHALNYEEAMLKLFEGIGVKTGRDDVNSNQRKLIEELRIIIFERYTPVVYRFRRGEQA